VAIRIRFPAEDPPVVELTSYPLTELALSLHTVADPRMQPRLAPFVRRARSRLPKQVGQDLSELAFLLGPPAPAPFAFPEGEPVAVPDALAAISPRDEDFQWSLSMHVDGTVPERLRPKGDSRAVLDELQRDPDAVAGRLLQLFRDYWTHAFSQEWPDVEARLALARTEAELQLASGGIGSLLSSSTRRARLSESGIAVTPTIPAEFDVAVHEDGRMPVVISLFSAPWVITRIMPAAGLVLPAPGTDAGRVTAPSIVLVQELDSIAVPTRLTLLRLVAARPRSTRELAQLLELSEAAISKHLRRLADAQLVRGERQGYYVLYSLIPERAIAASESLLAFLRVPSDSPAG
jgi:DNA-binding transcriptional ArsR family regulator